MHRLKSDPTETIETSQMEKRIIVPLFIYTSMYIFAHDYNHAKIMHIPAIYSSD